MQKDESQSQRSHDVIEGKFEQATCQECEFMLSCKMSQEIMELRKKLAMYQEQNKQINQFFSLEQPKIQQVLKPFNKAFQNQIDSETEAKKQLKFLKSELSEIQAQIEQEKLLENQYQNKTKQLSQQLKRLSSQQFQNEVQYAQLLKQNQSLNYKEAELKNLKSFFQKTNFITIIYSISFEDGDSYLNGDKVTPQNSWKIIEILAFYQEKYNSYHPIVQILWDKMQLFPSQTLGQEINSGHQQQVNGSSEKIQELITPICINCDDQNTILQSWIRYVILQMKNLFEFMVLQSGIHSRLKYEVTNEGEFHHVKEKTFQTQRQRFNLIIKCLLIGIDQINKLEFFAKQRRMKNSYINNQTIK